MGNVSHHESPEMLRVTEGNELHLRGQVARYHRSNEWCSAVILANIFSKFAKSKKMVITSPLVTLSGQKYPCENISQSEAKKSIMFALKTAARP